MEIRPDKRGILGKIALYILPEPIRFKLYFYFWQTNRREKKANVYDRQRISLQDDVELWTYWLDGERFGGGPCASLYVLQEEVLRLDCFDGEGSHMHLNPNQQAFAARMASRLYFPNGKVADQVERSAFELIANTDAALKSNRFGRIRSFQIDQQALTDAAGQMKKYMMELVERHSPASTSEPCQPEVSADAEVGADEPSPSLQPLS